jgi:hypothetical protein
MFVPPFRGGLLGTEGAWCVCCGDGVCSFGPPPSLVVVGVVVVAAVVEDSSLWR